MVSSLLLTVSRMFWNIRISFVSISAVGLIHWNILISCGDSHNLHFAFPNPYCYLVQRIVKPLKLETCFLHSCFCFMTHCSYSLINSSMSPSFSEYVRIILNFLFLLSWPLAKYPQKTSGSLSKFFLLLATEIRLLTKASTTFIASLDSIIILPQ